jgi:hypothetical protein
MNSLQLSEVKHTLAAQRPTVHQSQNEALISHFSSSSSQVVFLKP